MATTGIFLRLVLPVLAHICLGMEARSFQLGASGELKDAGDPMKDDEAKPVKALLRTNVDQAEHSTHKAVQNCHTDYVLGPPLSSACGNAETDSFVAAEDECEHAALRANVQYVKKFNPVIADGYPKKCFMMNCPGSATKPCMYWNRLEVEAPNITRGRAVCKRSRYVYGTAGTNPSTGCPAGYISIRERLLCEEIDSCMIEVALATPFETSLYHMDYYHHHPQYCYIAHDTSEAKSKIYFNPPVGPYTAMQEPDDPGCAKRVDSDTETEQKVYCGNLPLGGSPICKPANILFFLPSTATDNVTGSNGMWPAMYGLSDDENATTNLDNKDERYGRLETDECLQKLATDHNDPHVCEPNEMNGVYQALYPARDDGLLGMVAS